VSCVDHLIESALLPFEYENVLASIGDATFSREERHGFSFWVNFILIDPKAYLSVDALELVQEISTS